MRRPAKLALWSLGAVLLLLALAVGVVLIGGNTATGRLAIAALTKHLTGGTVQLSGLSGSFPSHLRLERLQLLDDRGVWLSADQISVDWNPGALLGDVVSVQNLQAASVTMQRLPHSTRTSGVTASIPRIDAAIVNVQRVDLGAELAGIPASLTLQGSAHLRSLRDMQFDAAAHRIDGEGVYELHLSFDPARMRAALRLQEPARGPLENLLSLPGLGGLDARVNIDGPRTAERLELSVQAGALTGNAHGTVNLRDATAELDIEVQSTAMQPRADVSWSRAEVRGHWSGGIQGPNASGHVAVAGLEAPGGLRLSRFNADLTAENGTMSMHGTAEGLQIPGPRPALLANDAIDLGATMQLNQVSRPVELHADHRLFSLRGRWLSAGKQSASLDLRLPDLTPLAALLGQRVRGTADIQGQVDYADARTQVSLNASADFLPAAGWPDMLGRHASAQLAGTLDGTALTIQTLHVSGRAVTASASGSLSLPQRNVRAHWDVNIEDLAALSPVLAGTFSSSGSVQGVPASLTIEAQANSKLSVRGGSSGELSAKVQMQGIPRAPAGTLWARGSLDGSPLEAEVSLERSASGVLHTQVRQADWKSAHLQGDLTTSLDTRTSRGHVSLQVGQLRDLQHLLGVDLGGSVMGNLDVRPEGGRTRLDLALQTQDLEVQGTAGSLQISGAGASDAFGFKIDARIPKLEDGPLALAAAGSVDFAAHSIKLGSATGDYHGVDVRLLSPTLLRFDNGLSIDGLKLGAKQAVLEVQGRVFPETSLAVALTGVAPELVNVFAANLLATGRIDAHAELRDSLRTPTGEITVMASDVRFADETALGLPPANLTVDAQLAGDTADLKVQLDGGAGAQLRVSGRAPLTEGGGLDLKIAGQLPLTLINPMLEARGEHAEGALGIDVSVTGSVDSPQIGGTAELSKGGFRDYVRGVNLTAISAQLVGSAAALEIKSLSATAAPGTLGVTGSIGVLQPKMPIELKITARHASPVVSNLVTANLDADLLLKGTLDEHVDIGGDVHVNRMLINIPNSLPPNVAVLDVRRRGVAAQRVVNRPLIIDLDVKVQAPQQIVVQGRGLNAEMGGELEITGNADSPRVSGGFDLQRGSFSLGSSNLSFSSGHVGFSGEGLQNKIDPTLDFTANTSIPQGTATLHITGYADAPHFDFTSTPALPQDEIMARLMFGESASQLTALQFAEVGYALASLSGVGGGGDSFNPLVKVQKTLGLDRLSFGSGTTTNAAGETTGASIEAGRYITKRVYIEAKQSNTGNSQLEADVDLTKRLKLQTRLGNGTASVQGTTPENDPGSSIGLIYQLEY
jgi:translocation and assembly module TamB